MPEAQSKEQVEAQIAAVIASFEQEQMGQGPSSDHSADRGAYPRFDAG